MKFILTLTKKNFHFSLEFNPGEWDILSGRAGLFNTHLTSICIDLRKFDRKLDFRFSNIDFQFIYQWTLYEVYTKC